MAYNRILLTSFAVVLIAGTIGFGVFQSKNSPNVAEGIPDLSTITLTSPEKGNGPAPVGNSTESPTSEWKTYDNKTLGFSLMYPPEYISNDLVAEDGAVIVTIGEKGNLGFGFQINITSFDESPASMTVERIRRDIPDLVMEEPQAFHFGNLAQGVSFISQNEIGKTREMWFATQRYLYQISAPIAFDPVLPKIMASWKFK